MPGPSLSERILAVLGESPLPVPTPDLVALTLPPGKPNARALVWDKLRGLERAGLVRRASRSPAGSTWVLAGGRGA